MINKEQIKREILNQRGVEITILEDGDTFDFKCDKCGKCCSNSTIDTILFKPYDIFKLSKGLNRNPEDIVNDFADIYIGDGSGFPILRMKGVPDFSNGFSISCPFLDTLSNGNSRCRVHNFKPGSCMLFPLGRLSAYDPDANVDPSLIYFVQDVSCGDRGELHTVNDWVGDMDYDAKILTMESKSIRSVTDIINMPKLKNLANKFLSTKDVLDSFYNSLFWSYYINFDISDNGDDFLVQSGLNLDSIILLTKTFAYTLLTHFTDTDISNYIREHIVVSSFETDCSDFIESMNSIKLGITK